MCTRPLYPLEHNYLEKGEESARFHFSSTFFKLPLITVCNSVLRGLPIFFFPFVSRSRDNWSTCCFSSLSYLGSDTQNKSLLLGGTPATRWTGQGFTTCRHNSGCWMGPWGKRQLNTRLRQNKATFYNKL